MKASMLLGAIAALLLAYILIFERGTLSSSELERRQGSALPELLRDRVTRIELQRKGVTTVLARTLDATDEEAMWRVEAPYKAEADRDAVDTLLGDLEWLHAKRRLTSVSAADLERFGLDKPRFRLWFTVGNKRVMVRVGAETPQSDGVYAQSDDLGAVMIVGKDFADALNREPGDFHTKTLHEGLLVSTARKLRLAEGQDVRAMQMGRDALWVIDEPSESAGLLASSVAIKELIEALDGLHATRYVTTDKAALPRYGLEPAQLDVALHKRGKINLGSDGTPKGKDAPDDIVLALHVRVGAQCEGHETERYLTVGDSGVVFCAHKADIEKLLLPVEQLRETRLLPVEPREIKGVVLSRGDRTLTLSRIGGIPQPGVKPDFRFELKQGDKSLASGTARDGSVDDFLQGLRSTEALSTEPRASIPPGAALTARLQRDLDKPDVVLKVAQGALDEALVQREGEPHPIPFSTAVLELLEPSAAPFRPLALLGLPAGAVRALTITRPGGVERLERAAGEGAALSVLAPVTAQADSIAASDVARLLAGLQAVRFAADSALGEHGLGAPELTVDAVFDAAPGDDGAKATAPGAGTRVRLEVGTATEGGHFARLVEGPSSGPSVFVVSAQLADLLRAPLISRALLSTPLERIAGAEITHALGVLRLERSGEQLVIAGASDALDSERARRLGQALATLRAQSVVGYGAARPEYGFAKPLMSLRVQRHDGSALQLSLGAADEDGARYARAADIDATFVLPAAAVRVLLDALATAR